MNKQKLGKASKLNQALCIILVLIPILLLIICKPLNIPGNFVMGVISICMIFLYIIIFGKSNIAIYKKMWRFKNENY